MGVCRLKKKRRIYLNNQNTIQILDRDIYLYGDINDSMALEVITRINHINEIDEMEEQAFLDDIESKMMEGLLREDSLRGVRAREPIQIEINSHGGSSSAGFAIITAIQNSETPIIGYVTGNCMSMAIPIIASCDFRIASEYAKFMIHDIYSASEGKFNDLTSSIEYIGSVREDYIRATAKHTKMTKEQVKEITDRNSDYFFSPDMAFELGLVDLIDSNKVDEEEMLKKLYGPHEVEGVEAEEEDDSQAFEKAEKDGEESEKSIAELVDKAIESRKKDSIKPAIGKMTKEEVEANREAISFFPIHERNEITIDSSELKGYNYFIDDEENPTTISNKGNQDGLISRIIKAFNYVIKG